MKHNRLKFADHHFTKRAGFFDSHHLRPRSRGGSNLGSNLIRMDAYRHSAYHLLFNNHTLEEVIAILQRLLAIKNAQKMRMKL